MVRANRFSYGPAVRRQRQTDSRYRTAKWKKVRIDVLNRDGWLCWAEGCDVGATVCDHIEPVHPAMTDAEFYDPRNLRASCAWHNVARGMRNVQVPSHDAVKSVARGGTRFLTAGTHRRSTSTVYTHLDVHTVHNPAQRVVTRDFSRRPVGNAGN